MSDGEGRSQRVCFASFEIAPFTAGGIGTWLRNTLDAYSERDYACEVLYYGDQRIDGHAFEARFPGVKLHAVDLEDPSGEFLPRDVTRQEKGFDTIAQWRSYVLAMALKKLERDTGPFDVIEFSDWGGPGFYAIQEKKLGNAFQSTILSVRLHCTEGMLRSVEHRAASLENFVLTDLETAALKAADVKAAHLDATFQSYHDRYGFGKAWVDGKVVQIPPVQVIERAKQTISIDPNRTPLLFTSKFQSVKRPDLFLRGVCEFLGANPHVRSSVVFCASDADESLRKCVSAMVPSRLKGRIQFLPAMDNENRERLIGSGVAVFPSSYEAFCYAAYEASLSGAVVILNGANPAFGDGTPWQDGLNCLKFDGTSHDLAHVLMGLYRKVNSGQSNGLSPIDIRHAEVPYWETLPPMQLAAGNAAEGSKRSANDKPKVSIVIPHRNDGPALSTTVSALLTEQAIPLEILVVDDASDARDSLHVLDLLEESSESAGSVLKFTRRHYHCGYADAVNSGAEKAAADIVCVLCPGDQVLPGFLETAVMALGVNREFDAIFPAMRIVNKHDRMGDALHFMPLGEALTTGLHVNRVCNGVFICRREVLKKNRLDETLASDWTWDFGMRLAKNGHGILSTAEPVVETSTSNIQKQVAKSERESRMNLDVIRRQFSIGGIGCPLPMASLREDEPVMDDGFSRRVLRLSRGQRKTGDMSAQSLDPEEELRQLRSSISVRLALAAAAGVENLTPWLHKPIRRLLRRRARV